MCCNEGAQHSTRPVAVVVWRKQPWIRCICEANRNRRTKKKDQWEGTGRHFPRIFGFHNYLLDVSPSFLRIHKFSVACCSFSHTDRAHNQNWPLSFGISQSLSSVFHWCTRLAFYSLWLSCLFTLKDNGVSMSAMRLLTRMPLLYLAFLGNGSSSLLRQLASDLCSCSRVTKGCASLHQRRNTGKRWLMIQLDRQTQSDEGKTRRMKTHWRRKQRR